MSKFESSSSAESAQDPLAEQALLEQELARLSDEIERIRKENSELRKEKARLTQELAELQEEHESLTHLAAVLERLVHGPKSERYVSDVRNRSR